MQGLRSNIDAVYDVTLAYRGPKPHPLNILKNIMPREVHIFVKRFPIEAIPADESDALDQWLLQRFIEKEELLTQYGAGESQLLTQYGAGESQVLPQGKLLSLRFVTWYG
jgi:lysocardiolipin and lysophospholipid acyltransferase